MCGSTFDMCKIGWDLSRHPFLLWIAPATLNITLNCRTPPAYFTQGIAGVEIFTNIILGSIRGILYYTYKKDSKTMRLVIIAVPTVLGGLN